MSVRISFGANTLSLEGQAGRTVGDIREDAENLLGLSGNEAARVNGQEVSDDKVVSEGEAIEFVKVAGSKG
ncbi:MAG: hypothetical protein MUC88_20730 [Planctomycetes bacterium]|jgi:hypothetical protein|nr:hypothetical protein [Planctomycetota bacterium]